MHLQLQLQIQFKINLQIHIKLHFQTDLQIHLQTQIQIKFFICLYLLHTLVLCGDLHAEKYIYDPIPAPLV